jgi:hypothetical protein
MTRAQLFGNDRRKSAFFAVGDFIAEMAMAFGTSIDDLAAVDATAPVPTILGQVSIWAVATVIPWGALAYALFA